MLISGENLPVGQILLKHSPNFRDDYPNNAYGFWEIKAPDGYDVSVRILEFESESGKDFLHIGEKEIPFSRNSRQWIHLTGHLHGNQHSPFSASSIIIIFTSDGSGRAGGFHLQCSTG